MSHAIATLFCVLRSLRESLNLTHLHMPNMTRIGLGAANIGGLFRPEKPSIPHGLRMLKTGFDVGIQMIDTGFYGNNAAETFIGRALEQMHESGSFTPGTLHIQAKVGRPIVPAIARFRSAEQVPWTLPGAFAQCADIWDFSADGIARHIAGCMQRMQPERLSCIALHDPDQAIQLGKVDGVNGLSDAVTLLQELREQRFCSQIAVAGKSVDGILEILNAFPGVFDIVQTTCYGLHMHAECHQKLLPTCKEQGASIYMAGPFGGNICSATNPRQPHPGGFSWAANYEPADDEKIQQVGRIFDIANSHGWVHLRHLCLWFCYLNPQIRKIIFGAETPEQLIENVAWLYIPPPVELLNALVEADLIDGNVPISAEHIELVPIADVLGN